MAQITPTPSGGILAIRPGVPEAGRTRTGPTLVMLHGAGSGVDLPIFDELDAALSVTAPTWRAARFTQPYRVRAGRRPPAPARQLDAALAEALGLLGGDPLVAVGRSSGARVALRVSAAGHPDVRLAAVVALGFPLVPPAGRPSRQGELDAAGCPVLVVQGSRDSFGVPAGAPGRDVVIVEGADHSLGRPAHRGVAVSAVLGWLAGSGLAAGG